MRFLKFACVIFLVHVSYGQRHDFETGKPASKSYHTEIPYEKVQGKLIIPVTIDNETYRFLFDTGAPNIISADLWRKIDSKTVKSISVADANQKRLAMEITAVSNMRLGDIVFLDSSALIFETENNIVFDCFEVDGIIGTNMLRESIVQIRPKEQLLIISNQKKSIDVKGHSEMELMLKSDQSSPYISIRLKGEQSGTEPVLIDTGASGFYDLSNRNYNQLKQFKIAEIIDTGEGSASIGIFGAADSKQQFRLRIPEIQLGETSFLNVITTTSDDNNSRIGSDILEYGIVTLDFKRKKFYFGSFHAQNDLTEKLLGMTPILKDGKLVVGIVWDDSLKTQIQSGDEILELNDMDLTNIDLCELVNRESPFKQNDTIAITVKRDNELKKLNLIKK